MQKFFNVRKKENVSIDDAKCVKVVYSRTTKAGTVQQRYAVKAVDEDGTNLTKFISKDAYDALKCKAE